jgi:hypothetical protein
MILSLSIRILTTSIPFVAVGQMTCPRSFYYFESCICWPLRCPFILRAYLSHFCWDCCRSPYTKLATMLHMVEVEANLDAKASWTTVPADYMQPSFPKTPSYLRFYFLFLWCLTCGPYHFLGSLTQYPCPLSRLLFSPSSKSLPVTLLIDRTAVLRT